MSTMNDESKIRARVFDVIRRVLDVPSLKVNNARKDFLAPPPMSSFRGVDPALLYEGDDWWIFNVRECTPSIVWPIDVCLIRGSADLYDMYMMRLRSVTPKEVRGYASRISPFMLRKDVAVHDRGKLITASGLLSFFGGRWSDAQKRTLWEGTADNPIPARTGNVSDGYLDLGGVAIGVALRQRYEWAVNVGFSNTPSVRIATDPTGMKELFRLRDVQPGRDRRDALMNWVSDHWRQNRRDPDVEIYVRKHMRGGTQFDWRGFNCEIIPARFDMEQTDKFIAERDAMRVAGSDRRYV
jgi:hypothetical protein